MLALAFLHWWYFRGWFSAYNSLGARLKRTYYGLSVPLLIGTLFSPWRRIITPSQGDLMDKLRSILDNLISRLVGFAVRVITLVTASIISIWWILLAIAQLIVWPFIPIAGIYFIVVGIL